jgi:hypothetical protein
VCLILLPKTLPQTLVKPLDKTLEKTLAHLDIAVHEPQSVDVGQRFQALHCYTGQPVRCEVHTTITATAATATISKITVAGSNSCSVCTQPLAKLVQVLLQQLAHYKQVLLRTATFKHDAYTIAKRDLIRRNEALGTCNLDLTTVFVVRLSAYTDSTQ